MTKLQLPPKAEQQDEQYAFPYHYVPQMDGDRASLNRSLRWGLEYLCYQHHVMELVSSVSPSSVLDVGCGDGFFLNRISSPDLERLGIDFSPRAIGLANALKSDGARFIVGNVTDIVETFDVVLAIEVLEHIPDNQIEKFLKSTYARVAPGGYLIISVPSKVQTLHPKHYRHYDEALLRDQLSVIEKYQIENIDFVYKHSVIADIVMKLASNRFFSFEMPNLTTFAWRHVWKNCRNADATSGYHIVAMIRKE